MCVYPLHVLWGFWDHTTLRGPVTLFPLRGGHVGTHPIVGRGSGRVACVLARQYLGRFSGWCLE